MSTETPSTAWKENIAPGESERFDALAATLRQIQREYGAKRSTGRALHYKPHVAVRARLETRADAPAWTRVGIFAAAGHYDAYVRFSNGGGRFQKDSAPDVRGIAVKVVGVPGEKLIPPLRDAKTQDFLAILADSFAFRTPDEFVAVVRAASGSPLLALPRIIGALGLRTPKVLGALKEGMSRPVDSMAKQVYFSNLPLRWGDYAVKFSLVPHAAPEPAGSVDPAAADRLRRDLVVRLKEGALGFDLRIQPFVDEATTPIEDPGVAWTEQVSPWTTIATLTIPRQDVESEGGKELERWLEERSFDPWHAPLEFRPLGATMRARNAAYRESTAERGAKPEPDGSERWPHVDDR